MKRITGKNVWRNRAKREAAKRRMLMNVINERECGYFGGIVVSDPCFIPDDYYGLVLEINDHGNISLLRAFKNGNTHYVYGIV